MITLKVFKDQLLDLVWQFEEFWKDEHEKSPEDFPLDMPEEEWNEQFLVWLSMQ